MSDNRHHSDSKVESEVNCFKKGSASMFPPMRTFAVVCVFIVLSFGDHAVAQTITSITPSSVEANSGGFVLTISGSDFDSASIVQLHTSSGIQMLQTYFVNSGLLMAGVYSDDVVNPGTLQVDVADYATQSSSNAVNLTVSGPGSGGSGSGSGSSSGSGGGGSGSGSSSGSSGGSS